MAPSIKKIFDEVNKLTPFEQIKIIDLILESFDDRADKKIGTAWINEVKIRIDSYRKMKPGQKLKMKFLAV